MTNKHFMLDIESTGVSLQRDKVLEIGILEVDFIDCLWKPGAEFRQLIHYPGQPESQFAKEHMAPLYARCNEAPFLATGAVRSRLVGFFAGCGVSGHGVLLMGWNAANFDVPMLHAHGLLVPPGYSTVNGVDSQVGDHHYRIYEMCGAVQLAQDVLQERWETLKPRVLAAGGQEPEGKAHDALYDCYQQVRILNGLIEVIRREVRQ